MLQSSKPTKPRPCKVCRTKTDRRYGLTPLCGIEHAAEWAEKRGTEKRAKEERALVKVRREKLKTRSEYLKEAQIAFNAYIRERDKDKPCICCGRASTGVSGLGAHGWDCGHYRSVGSAPHLRFDERNAHRQLVVCNRYGAGRAVDYRIGLIQRIGVAAVESLEADVTPRKWTIDDLKAIRAEYRVKLKELKA